MTTDIERIIDGILTRLVCGLVRAHPEERLASLGPVLSGGCSSGVWAYRRAGASRARRILVPAKAAGAAHAPDYVRLVELVNESRGPRVRGGR